MKTDYSWLDKKKWLANYKKEKMQLVKAGFLTKTQYNKDVKKAERMLKK